MDAARGAITPPVMTRPTSPSACTPTTVTTCCNRMTSPGLCPGSARRSCRPAASPNYIGYILQSTFRKRLRLGFRAVVPKGQQQRPAGAQYVFVQKCDGLLRRAQGAQTKELAALPFRHIQNVGQQPVQ